MLRKSYFRWAPTFTPIFMPSLSPSMEKGRIVEWKKRPGDAVKEGDVWCTIETDKAVVEYTNAMETGYLAKTFAKGGDQVNVGSTIAVLVEKAGDVANADQFTVAAPSALEQPPASPSSVTTSTTTTTTKDSVGGSPPADKDALRRSGPSVSRIVATLQREDSSAALATVKPSGKGGRFVKADFCHLDAFHYHSDGTATAPAPPCADDAPKTLFSAPQASSKSSTTASPNNSTDSAAAMVRPTAVVDFTISDTKLVQRLLSHRQ